MNILEHRAALVALEAHVTDDVLGLVRGVSEDIHRAFGDFVARFATNLPGLSFTPSSTQFLREVGKHNYMAIRPLQVCVPAGLKSTYLDYLAPLSQAVAHATAVQSNVLNPYAMFLAGLLTNHDAASSAKSITAGYPALQAERDQLNKAMGACFAKGGQEANSELGKVVARNSDWPAVMQQTDALVQAINRVDRKALDKKMHECVELLEVLRKKLERREFGDMSGEVASNLAAGAYQSALELEFFSVIYYRVTALSESVNKTVEQLMRVFTH